MLQEYLEVSERRGQEKLALARIATLSQQKTAEDSGRVVTASASTLDVLTFAEGMGRVFAQNDFSKVASLKKEALNLAGMGSMLAKNPLAVGAAAGGVLGAAGAGEGNRLSGALGGAALGAGAGHAGVGIGKRMLGRGQTLGQAAGNYGTEVRRRAQVAAGSLRQQAAPRRAAAAPAAAARATAPTMQAAAPAAAAPMRSTQQVTRRVPTVVPPPAQAPTTLQGRPSFDSSFGGGMPDAPSVGMGRVVPVPAGQQRPSLLHQAYSPQQIQSVQQSLGTMQAPVANAAPQRNVFRELRRGGASAPGPAQGNAEYVRRARARLAQQGA